jgi:hypothetical protein
MNQQFLRMQQLAGIKPAKEDYNEVIDILVELHLHTNYYSKGILKENINEISLKGIYTNIKDRFTKLSSKNKKFVQNIIDLIKSKGDNPTELFKTMADFIQLSGGLKQALKKLSSDDLQEADPKNKSTPSTGIGVVKQKYGSIAAGLMMVAAAAGIGQQLVNNIGPTVDKAFDVGIEWNAQYNQNTFSEKDPGVIDYNMAMNMMNNPDTDTVNKALDNAIQNAQSTVTDIDNEFNKYNVNDNGADLNDDENSAVVVRTHDVGEYELSQSEIDKAAEELANKVLSKIKQDLQNNSDKKIETIKISSTEISSISHQDGKNSNVANDGSNLGQGRIDTSNEIGDKTVDVLKDKLKPLIDQGIEVEFTDSEEIDTSKSVNKQKIQTAQDDLSTQSSVVKADIEVEYGDKGIPLNYIPTFFDPDAGDQKDFSPVGGKKGETKKEKNKEKDKESTPPPPVGGEGGVDIISKLNRNGQIAYLLSRTSPKLNLFAAANKEIGSLSDNDLKKVIDSEQSSDTIKKLAKLIPNLRKSPDTLLKKFSSATGIKLQPRAKAIATRPGKDTQAQLQKTQENKIMLSSLLQEALIDDVFNELGVTDDVIKANKIELLALLGSMYASAGDNTLSILDTKELSDTDKAKLKSFGFQPQAGGNYVFLGAGETKASYFDKLQNKTKTQPDVTRVSNAIEKDVAFKRFLGKLDNKNELSSFILALFLYKDTKGKVLFDPKQTFATDAGKVRAAMFGLNNRIPNTLTEEESDDLIRKFPDVQAAYTYIGKSSTLRSLLQNINTIEEFYQLVLRSILPHINPKFKTKDGVGELKGAIALAANKSKEFQDILNKKKKK